MASFPSALFSFQLNDKEATDRLIRLGLIPSPDQLPSDEGEQTPVNSKGKPQASLSFFPGELDLDAEGMAYVYYDKLSFADRVALIGLHFNITPEDICGSYYVQCQVNKMPCNNCRGIPDSIGCPYGRLSVKGLTGFAAYRLFDLAQQELIRQSLRLGALVSGKFPWSAESATSADKGGHRIKGMTRDQVEAKIHDPFKNFPYDVSYPSESKVLEFAKVNKVAHAAGFCPAHDLWSEERIEACLQTKNILARRCSLNGNLWNLYKTTPGLTLEGVKRRLQASYWAARLDKATTEEEKVKCMNALLGV